MKLLLINGSPRGKSSNTKILLDQFKEGFSKAENRFGVDEMYLVKEKDRLSAGRLLLKYDAVILAFPLYTDSMPGIVKEFIETIDPERLLNHKFKLGFIVQSGFPESHHSSYIERYLIKLTDRLGAEYLGTIIKGGVEGIKIQPKWMTKYLASFHELGKQLALTWEFDEEIIFKLKNPVYLKGMKLTTYKLLMKTGLSNFYWDKQLKENNAYNNRFNKPYLQS